MAGNSLGGLIALIAGAEGDARSVTALSPAGFWRTRAQFAYTRQIFLRFCALSERLGDRSEAFARTRAGRKVVYGLLCAHPARVTPDQAIGDARAFRYARPALKLLLEAAEPFDREIAPRRPGDIAWAARDLVLPPWQADPRPAGAAAGRAPDDARRRARPDDRQPAPRRQGAAARQRRRPRPSPRSTASSRCAARPPRRDRLKLAAGPNGRQPPDGTLALGRDDNSLRSRRKVAALTLLNIGIVLLLIVIEGVFVAAEIALVSLRESQIRALVENGRARRRAGEADPRPEPVPGHRADRRHLHRAAVQRVRGGHAVRRGQEVPRRARLERGAGQRHRHRRRHPDHLVRHPRARRARAEAPGAAAGREGGVVLRRPAQRHRGVLPSGHLAAVEVDRRRRPVARR